MRDDVIRDGVDLVQAAAASHPNTGGVDLQAIITMGNYHRPVPSGAQQREQAFLKERTAYLVNSWHALNSVLRPNVNHPAAADHAYRPPERSLDVASLITETQATPTCSVALPCPSVTPRNPAVVRSLSRHTLHNAAPVRAPVSLSLTRAPVPTVLTSPPPPPRGTESRTPRAPRTHPPDAAPPSPAPRPRRSSPDAPP